MTDRQGNPLPTGECWCNCGESTGRGAFFRTGHDRRAVSYVLEIKHKGSIAQFLLDKGYGPGGKNLKEELEEHRAGQSAEE